MDEQQRRIEEYLRAKGMAHEPPSWLGAQIMRQVHTRRRHRRAVAAMATVFVLAAVPAIAVTANSLQERVTVPVLASPSPGRWHGLEEFVDPASVKRVPRVLPDGLRFHAMALSPDGEVLGTGRSAGAQGRPQGVWAATWEDPLPRAVKTGAPDPYLWAMAAGENSYMWPNGGSLECVVVGSGGAPRVLDDRWNARTRFFTDRGVLVWTREDRKGLVVTDHCGGRQEVVPAEGLLEAVAYPYAYMRQEGRINRVHLESGEQVALQASLSPWAQISVAANAQGVAWTDGDTLTYLDRGWPVHRPVRLKDHPGDQTMGRLMYGNRLLVYLSDHSDQDIASSFVYDPSSGREVSVPVEVLAAGDWLLWRDGDVYLVARVRQHAGPRTTGPSGPRAGNDGIRDRPRPPIGIPVRPRPTGSTPHPAPRPSVSGTPMQPQPTGPPPYPTPRSTPRASKGTAEPGVRRTPG
ncbi:hypothetical protein [Sinosporangium siamense]|uniref:Uncharacterized protein n=1 Tax=Sinosporangium siamense TaxID=1367973 RepID=A0A919VA49_9ACTN|nr:hypothetical protein [Sinosporangium siamense]GII90754.1 hypothetical protein Ssi02_09850 [Sinosporangium siamense]